MRLACVKRAANVRSEPGSNSPIKLVAVALREERDALRLTSEQFQSRDRLIARIFYRSISPIHSPYLRTGCVSAGSAVCSERRRSVRLSCERWLRPRRPMHSSFRDSVFKDRRGVFRTLVRREALSSCLRSGRQEVFFLSPRRWLPSRLPRRGGGFYSGPPGASNDSSGGLVDFEVCLRFAARIDCYGGSTYQTCSPRKVSSCVLPGSRATT